MQKKGGLAHEYWKKAENSQLAPAEFYIKQKEILTTYIMPNFRSGNRLLDIGCSNGEFTELLARDSSYALGIDLSNALISQAKKRSAGKKSLHFEVADIVRSEVSGEFSIVSCMGLFTCLTKEDDFKQAVSHIMEVLQPGGYLVLKDSLMANGENEAYFNNKNYEAIYRSETDYLAEFTNHGLNVVQRHVLPNIGQLNQVGIIYLLHRPLSQSPLKINNSTNAKIAILYQLPESWSNVRSVWLAAKERTDVDIVVVLLPFYHSQLEWHRTTVEQRLQKENIEYICWDEFNITEAMFDIVIYTSPYDITRPKSYYFSELKEKAITAYIPYGLEVGGGAINLSYQYGQPVATGATAVFVRSDGAKNMFKKYCPAGDEHVIVTGHPRMDGLVDLEKFNIDPGLIKEIGGRKAILWNAHFSFDGNQWSTFDLFSFDIITAALQYPEIALIFRPHPLLWKKLITLNIFSSCEVEQLKEELRALGVVVDERADYRHAFAASSALMTDAGSFLLEYLVTEKPVLYLCNKNGLGLNEEGESVLRYYRKALTKDDIILFLEQIIDDEYKSAALEQTELAEFFYSFDGCSGHRVLEHLLYIYKL